MRADFVDQEGRPWMCQASDLRELRAENERLTEENRKMNTTLSKDAIQIFELEAENERLRTHFLIAEQGVCEDCTAIVAKEMALADQGKG